MAHLDGDSEAAAEVLVHELGLHLGVDDFESVDGLTQRHGPHHAVQLRHERTPHLLHERRAALEVLVAHAAF